MAKTMSVSTEAQCRDARESRPPDRRITEEERMGWKIRIFARFSQQVIEKGPDTRHC